MNKKSQKIEHLNKILTVGIDRTHTMLSTITSSPLKFQMKTLEILSPEQLLKQLKKKFEMNQVCAMELIFTGNYEGMTQLIFPPESAETLIRVIETEERRKLDKGALEKEILSEVGNIFFNGVMGVISTLSEYGITYMIPKYKVGNVGQLMLSSWARKYSIAVLATVQFDSQRDLYFWIEFNTLEPLLEESHKLSDYFER